MGDARLNRMIEQAKLEAEAKYRQFREGPLCDKKMLEALFEECRVRLAEIDDDGWTRGEVARTLGQSLESKLPEREKSPAAGNQPTDRAQTLPGSQKAGLCNKVIAGGTISPPANSIR